MKKLLLILYPLLVFQTNLNAEGFFSTSKREQRKCIKSLTERYRNERDILIKKLHSPKVIENLCSCYVSNKEINPLIKSNSNVPTSIGQRVFKSCSNQEVYTYLYGGDVFFKDEYFSPLNPGKFSKDYSVNVNSIKQEKIRGKYGRYITFYGRTTNSYSGETIQAKPGFIDCDWGGSGSAYYNKNYGSVSWSSDGYCYGEEGTPEKVIPGGVDRQYFKYTLDCKDKTFDRKGDRVNYAGGAMKGWMKTNNDPTAILAQVLYCDSINELPKK